jgi:SAM-dependent methyltransferase
LLLRTEPQQTSKSGRGIELIERACGGCHRTRGRSLGYKRDYELVQCVACGSISTQGLEPSAARSSDIYEHYYDGASFQTPAVTAVSLNRLAVSFERFRNTGRWLDIGYGEGGLLAIAQGKGWSCYGTEIASHSLEYGDRRGWVVARDAERDPRFPPTGFDIVTMIEFLEHVSEPDRFLNAAAQWLRPGGLLYLTTPNALSLNRRLLGLDWSVLAPPDHVIIWTPVGLRRALARNGFQVSQMRTEGLNPCEIKARIARRFRHEVAINRSQAAVKLNDAISKNAFRRAIKRGVNAGLSALRAGDTIKAWAVKE